MFKLRGNRTNIPAGRAELLLRAFAGAIPKVYENISQEQWAAMDSWVAGYVLVKVTAVSR